jgi:hypothetical protein
MNIHHSENIKSNSVIQLCTCNYSDLTIQQCILQSLSLAAKLATVLHPIPRLTMYGTLPPLPYTPSWGAEEQLKLGRDAYGCGLMKQVQATCDTSNCPKIQ